MKQEHEKPVPWEHDPVPMPFSRRSFVCLLTATLTAPLSSTSGEALAADDDVRIVDFDWRDEARDRLVPARLHWPAAAFGVVPLIVFSHGLGGSRQGYSYLSDYWSARGVASLHVQHIGSDRSVWGGNPFGLIERLQAAARQEEALARASDVSFALDRILDRRTSPFAARIDRRRIVAAGHSYGANTTLILTGASVEREGRSIGRRDPRFRAGLVISAPPFYGERDLASVLRGVEVPTFHITATGDVIEVPGLRSPVQDRIDVYAAIGSPRKMLAVFQGGSHSMFTDRALTGGIDLNPQVKAATAEAGIAFLDLAFRGDPTSLMRWTDTWRPILAFAPTPFQTVMPKAHRRSASEGLRIDDAVLAAY